VTTTLSSDRGTLPTPVAAEQTAKFDMRERAVPTDWPSRTKGNTRTPGIRAWSRAADAAEETAGGGAYTCWQTAARRLVRDERYRGRLKLVERAAAAVEAAEWPASPQADSLLDACAIADPGR
jgi:hypothetical protein